MATNISTSRNFDGEERSLTLDECEELAAAIFEDAAPLPPGPTKREMLTLGEAYRSLGKMKRLVLQNVS